MALEDKFVRKARKAQFQARVIAGIKGNGYEDYYPPDFYRSFVYDNQNFHIIDEASSETRGSSKTDKYYLQVKYRGKVVLEEDGLDNLKIYDGGEWEERLNQIYLSLLSKTRFT